MAYQFELHDLFGLIDLLLVAIFFLHLVQLVKVWCYQYLDQLVVRPGGDEPTRLAPINAVNGAIVVLLLFEDHLNTVGR